MSIFIRTFGCTLNQSDSELMEGLLLAAGFKVTNSMVDADLVIFNTCTVKDRAEKRFFSELQKAINAGKKIIAAGCISQSDPDNEQLKGISVIGVRCMHLIAEAVERTLKGENVRYLDLGNNPRLNMPVKRRNPIIEIIPISAGCLGECSYCKTKLARGGLYSYSVNEIKAQFEKALSDGALEIWLTSQDLGAYGKDIESSLSELLKVLMNIKGEHRIRLGMINPNHAMEYKQELAEFLKSKNAFKFLHMPFQSGSDRILKLMKRKYSISEFIGLVKFFRSEIEGITIATDVICGFPGETEGDFYETMDVVRSLGFPVLNISRYSTRKGTEASKMDKVSTAVSKRRSLALANQQKNIDNSYWLGWKGRIILDEFGKKDSVLGRNDWYRQIVVKNCRFKPGIITSVRIIKTHQHYLEGLIV